MKFNHFLLLYGFMIGALLTLFLFTCLVTAFLNSSSGGVV